MNPLLDFSGLPRFNDIQPAHIQPAVDLLVGECRAVVESLVASSDAPTWG